MGIVVTMRDMFSRNAARIESSMESLDAKVAASSERMTRNLDRIQKGTMLMGAGLALMAAPAALVASTAATQKALGEMASLGTKDLRALEDAAESFTNTWAGSSKAEFIGACYDVKSALSSLSDEAVGTFGAMAALTAKATKATTQEMVGTFTTAYGIFKPIMRGYSDMEWAEAFSGAMAQTVAAFKTTGAQMAEAIKNVGATAAASNIPLQEQLAVLGQLQTTMPGSEAGTLYKAFVMKAAEAGRELGLSFVDYEGRLKGVIPILRELQNRFPDLSQAAAQVQIKKAFGSDEAVKFVLQMAAGMDTLQGNIESVETAMKAGTATTTEMARAMNADIGAQFALAKQQVGNLFEILGRTLLPVVTPVMAGVSRVVLGLQRLAKAAPGVTVAVLGLALALGAVLAAAGAAVAAVGAVGLLMPAVSAGIAAMGPALAGAGAAVAAYFWPITLAVAGVIGAVYLLRRAWNTNFAGIRDMVVGVWNKASLALQGLRALIASFRDGTGEMSAELAQKLQAAGLMGFVTTVFQVYTRVRAFVEGFASALGHAFGRVRAILEPPIRALLNAFASVWRALFSVVEVFDVVGTAADASSFQTFGEVLGTLLGVVAQAAAIILRGLVYPLAFVVRVLAVVVRAVVWVAKTIVTAFVESARFVLKFLLPVRLLVEAFRLAGRVIYSVWRILTGDVSLTEGLKNIGGAVFRFLTTPFRWAWDVIRGVWDGVKAMFAGAVHLLSGLASAVMNAFLSLPLVSTLADVFGTVRSFLSGDLGFFEAGKAVLGAFAWGIWSAVTFPYQMLKKALGWLRRLLPFSDAEEGPLADLTASGASLLRTLAQGMLGVLGLPGKILGFALKTAVRAVSWAWGALKTAGAGLVSVVSWPFRKAADVARGAWDGIKAGARGIWDGLSAAGSVAANVVTAPVRWMAGAASAVWNGMAQGATSAWNKAVTLARSGASAITAAQDWLAAKGTAAWSAIRAGAVSAWNGVTSAVSAAAGTVATTCTRMSNAAGRMWSALTTAATSAWGRMTSLARNAGAWLRAPFDALASTAARSWEKVRAATTGAWGSMESSVSGLVRSAAVRGRGMLDTAVAGIRSVLASPVENARNALGRAWKTLSLAGRGNTATTPVQSAKVPRVLDSVLPEIASAADALAQAIRAAGDRVFGFAANGLTGAVKPIVLAGVAAASSLSAMAETSPRVPDAPVHVATAVRQAAPMPERRVVRDIPASFMLTPVLAETPPVMTGDIGLRPWLSGMLPPVASSVALTPVLREQPATVAGELGLTPVVRNPVPPLASSVSVTPFLTAGLPPVTAEAAVSPRALPQIPGMKAPPALSPEVRGAIPNVSGGLDLTPRMEGPVPRVSTEAAVRPVVTGALPPAVGRAILTPQLVGSVPRSAASLDIVPRLAAGVPPVSSDLMLRPRTDFSLPAITGDIGLRPHLTGPVPEAVGAAALSPVLSGRLPAVQGQAYLRPIVPKTTTAVRAEALMPPVLPTVPSTMAEFDARTALQNWSVPEIATAIPVAHVLSLKSSELPENSRREELSPDRARLLGAARGTAAGASAPPISEDGIQVIRHLMESALAKLDALVERPIAVSLTTTLDGRQIAQSVYKDLRERKVRNYETL